MEKRRWLRIRFSGGLVVPTGAGIFLHLLLSEGGAPREPLGVLEMCAVEFVGT